MLKKLYALGEKPTLLVFGIGDLAFRVLQEVVQRRLNYRVVVAARDTDAAIKLVNLILLSAVNGRRFPDLSVVANDLRDAEQTALTLAKVNPDVVFMAASLQSWRRLTELPPTAFAELDEAQLGPWLPMHLALNYSLAQALAEVGSRPVVVNAAYPDAVGPVLAGIDAAPDIGIGNVANVVPALQLASARLLDVKPWRVQVKLVAHHFFSHGLPRFGASFDAPHLLSVFLEGRKEEISPQALFDMVATTFKRSGGTLGQTLTASSAAAVLEALLAAEPVAVHAPAPFGLPGGYPVLVGGGSIGLDLPSGVSIEDAVEVNERGQTLDGIEEIASGGCIRYTAQNMAVMSQQLGYATSAITLESCFSQAATLAQLFDEYSRRVGAQNV